MDGYITRYFLTLEGVGKFEVDKARFVKAERSAGFRPRYGAPDTEPCTGGFTAGVVRGSIAHEKVPTTVPTEPAYDPVGDLAARDRFLPDPNTGREWIEGQPF